MTCGSPRWWPVHGRCLAQRAGERAGVFFGDTGPRSVLLEGRWVDASAGCTRGRPGRHAELMPRSYWERRSIARGRVCVYGTAMPAEGGTVSGEVAFRLYDTYGFPLDLTEVIARNAGCTVAAAGMIRRHDESHARHADRCMLTALHATAFLAHAAGVDAERLLDAQRERSRGAWAAGTSAGPAATVSLPTEVAQGACTCYHWVTAPLWTFLAPPSPSWGVRPPTSSC